MENECAPGLPKAKGRPSEKAKKGPLALQWLARQQDAAKSVSRYAASLVYPDLLRLLPSLEAPSRAAESSAELERHRKGVAAHMRLTAEAHAQRRRRGGRPKKGSSKKTPSKPA